MFKNILNKIVRIISFTMILSILLLPISFQAQQSSQSLENKSIITEQYTGELIKKDNNTLSITKDKEVNEYKVANEIKIKRDGLNSTLDKLQAGDVVLVTINKNTKELLSVEVVSKGVLDNSIKIIGGIVSLLLLLGIIFYLIKKSNKDIIRTTTTSHTPIN